MALPNLIALIGLRHVVNAETKIYFQQLKEKGKAKLLKKVSPVDEI